MIDRKNVFDQPVKNNTRTYDQGHDYTIGCVTRLCLFQKLLEDDSYRFK